MRSPRTMIERLVLRAWTLLPVACGLLPDSVAAESLAEPPVIASSKGSLEVLVVARERLVESPAPRGGGAGAPAQARRSVVRQASTSGTDLDQLEQDVGSEEVLRRIQRDLRSAETLQLQGTPSLFINGRPYRGPFADGALTLALEQLLRSGDPISP